PHLSFYAGVPLINPDGVKLGTLCVVDATPKQLTDLQKITLKNLSKLVINQFELRRKTKELENDKTLYFRIIEDAGDVIYTANRQGYFTYLSKSVLKLTGYSHDELIGKHFTTLIIPEWKNKVKLFYYEQFKTRTSETVLEFVIQTKNKEKKWVEQNVVLVEDNKQLVKFHGIVRNIHSRKQTEELLTIANEKLDGTKKTLQSILDNALSLIFIKDLEGRYLFVNRQYEKIFHESINTIFMKTDHDLRIKEIADRFRKTDQIVIESGKALEFEQKMKVDGTQHTYLTTKFPLYNEYGQLYGICGMATDITTHKKNEAILRERDERFSKIFNISPVAMSLWAIHPEKLVEVNQSFEILTGLSKKETLNINPWEIFKLSPEETKEYNLMFSGKGHSKNMEFQFIDKKGTEKHI
ncbi:MAG TPA: PAS domain S-box protein, partial [Nitrosopumilaceae archaeon]|nr:PAS domain S-box protein [Nitrosopumilaceae archaeon]